MRKEERGFRSPTGSRLVGDRNRTTCIVRIPRQLMREDCTAIRTVPPPEQMLLLDVLHQPFFVKCRGVRASFPLAYEADGAKSETLDPVVISQVGGEVNPLDSSGAPLATFHPTAGVDAQLRRAGNRDQPMGILKRVRKRNGICVRLTSSVKSWLKPSL